MNDLYHSWQTHFHKIVMIPRSQTAQDHKRYQCPVPYCSRGYDSWGGCKYHVYHAHSKEEVDAAKGLSSRETGHAHGETSELDECCGGEEGEEFVYGDFAMCA